MAKGHSYTVKRIRGDSDTCHSKKQPLGEMYLGKGIITASEFIGVL